MILVYFIVQKLSSTLRNNVKITNKFNPKSVFFVSFYEWLYGCMDRIDKFVFKNGKRSKVKGQRNTKILF